MCVCACVFDFGVKILSTDHGRQIMYGLIVDRDETRHLMVVIDQSTDLYWYCNLT